MAAPSPAVPGPTAGRPPRRALLLSLGGAAAVLLLAGGLTAFALTRGGEPAAVAAVATPTGGAPASPAPAASSADAATPASPPTEVPAVSSAPARPAAPTPTSQPVAPVFLGTSVVKSVLLDAREAQRAGGMRPGNTLKAVAVDAGLTSWGARYAERTFRPTFTTGVPDALVVRSTVYQYGTRAAALADMKSWRTEAGSAPYGTNGVTLSERATVTVDGKPRSTTRVKVVLVYGPIEVAGTCIASPGTSVAVAALRSCAANVARAQLQPLRPLVAGAR